MERSKVKRLFYNFILTALLLMLTVVAVIGISARDVLSMEQQVRCGLSEHHHTDECYLDGVLLCKKKAHTHTENCYLILLGDAVP